MKRFTETTKWTDPWFRRLTSGAKQLWGYLLDHCDNIGLVEVDLSLISADCGQKINESHVLELGDRVQPIGGGKYFLPKFIWFQYGELSQSCPPHRSIIRAVELHGLVRSGIHYHYPSTTLALGQPKGTVTLQDKEKEKDKEKDKDITKEPVREFPESLNSDRVKAKWQAWVIHRRSMKKPKSWTTLFNEQVDWLCQFNEPEVFEILSASLRNGWQGLFEPKPGAVGNGNGKPMSPLDYRTIIQAKEAQATELYNRHCSESALSKIWDSQANRDKFATLRREIKELNAKLGSLGGSR